MNSTYKSVLLQKIQHYRLEKKWCQEAMADAIGTCQSNYSSLESGKHSLSIDQFLAICQALDRHPAEFFQKEEA
jgi:transcriptional regulator with XRE-family HTH domain